jgi:uncharacterized protein YodC (DUF2158 family)
MRIDAGDRVRLKSGGPVMTVETVDPDGQATCCWLEGKPRKKRREHFAVVTLERLPKQSIGAIGFVF